MKRKLIFIVLSLFFCMLFFLLSYAVKKHHLTSFDFDTTVRLQNHTPLRLDKVFPLFSSLASIEIMGGVLLVILLLYRKIKGILILILFFASHSVELFGKVFINHPPPPFMFYKHLDAVTYQQFQKYYVQPGSSYPSGHSFRVMFVAMIAAYIIFKSKKISVMPKIVGISAFFGVVLLVSISRISLGEHWASDVIGGLLFGMAMSFLGFVVL